MQGNEKLLVVGQAAVDIPVEILQKYTGMTTTSVSELAKVDVEKMAQVCTASLVTSILSVILLSVAYMH